MRLVSERLTPEVDRASATPSDRVAGVERLVQLQSRIEARFHALTREVDLLREEMAHSVEPSCCLKFVYQTARLLADARSSKNSPSRSSPKHYYL